MNERKAEEISKDIEDFSRIWSFQLPEITLEVVQETDAKLQALLEKTYLSVYAKRYSRNNAFKYLISGIAPVNMMILDLEELKRAFDPKADHGQIELDLQLDFICTDENNTENGNFYKAWDDEIFNQLSQLARF